MWDNLSNFVKVAGGIGALVTVTLVLARVWSGAAREQLIKVLQKELDLSRTHAGLCDQTVLHYRDEMHNTRTECDGAVNKARAEVDTVKEEKRKVEIENARLAARTDLSPVMEVMTKFIKEQTDINQQILAALIKLGKQGQAAA